MANHASESINVGVAEVYFTRSDKTIPVYLGMTQEGVSVTYETEWHEIKADQFGGTLLDEVAIGQNVKAEFKVLNTAKKHIKAVYPTANADGDEDNPDRVTFGDRPGLRATHHAGLLRIHPVSMGNDRSYDVLIYRTANTGNINLSFKVDDEWRLECVYKGYFDDLRKPGDNLFCIGADEGSGEVYRRVILFWITPANPETTVGQSVVFRANAMYEDGSTEDVTAKCAWLSSDPSKVSLSGSSIKTAEALAEGSVVIRAEYIGYSNSTSMVVTNA